MNIRPLFFALPFVAALAGCNPHGTCIAGDETSELGATCSLDYPKNACDGMTKSTFFKEEKVAGLLRCKSDGFELRKGGGDNMLFKSAKKK